MSIYQVCSQVLEALLVPECFLSVLLHTWPLLYPKGHFVLDFAVEWRNLSTTLICRNRIVVKSHVVDHLITCDSLKTNHVESTHPACCTCDIGI